MKKYKVVVFVIISVFVAYLIFEVNRSSKIPEHIHSVDDKPVDQRTDEENITVLERALQKEPENVRVMLELADMYIKTNETDHAKDYLKKILKIDPANKDALKKLESIK
jgi:cytochrome c-type biogenesis protein CcmH/NrfG